MEISYHVSWRRNSGGGGNCNAETVTNGNLLSGEGSLTCQSGCSGTITSMSYICTDFSSEENWSFGERRLVYDFSSVSSGVEVTIGFSGNAWISPFSSRWNLPTTFNLTRRNDTGRINSTPRAITSPVIRLQERCNHTISLAVSDPDGDTVRCRWALGTECGGICNQFPGAVLDQESCTIKYEANRGARYWAAALMIEDFSAEATGALSSVALQFLVLVISSTDPCSQKPTFIPPTIRQGVCVAIPPLSTFETQLTADSGAASVSIVEIQTTSPLGTRKGVLQHMNSSTIYYVNITWTPDDSQQNQTHLFCYTAVNSDGLASEQTCIKLLPGHHPPMILQGTAMPNQQLVHPSNTTWRVRFDSEIERPSVSAFVSFHDNDNGEVVYKIDSSHSQEVTFDALDEITISPNYVFEEKKRFYITLERSIVQGLAGCGPGNEPLEDKTFWIFETMDVTAPIITFLKQPFVSNTNVTLSWVSNEEAIWECKLIIGAIQLVINCSDASWSGYGLNQGTYILEINATDAAGNKATVVHAFEVDLTPPFTTIVQKPLQLSNHRSATFTFVCNELCTFECEFLSNNISLQTSSCNGGWYTTPVLEHNGNYTLHVTATDAVGNIGHTAEFRWETDFDSPHVYGVSDTSVQCTNVSPQVTGRPQATDDRSEVVSLMHSDVQLGCSIRRTWTARDDAGNTAQLTQILNLEFSPTLSLSPQVAFSCDSTANSIQVPSNTASAPNPCRLPLQLTYMDFTGNYACPAEFVRNWTVTVCDMTASAEQTIILYDLCPPYACGRNETIPHGLCSFGVCHCNRPWHGEDCSVLIYEPLIRPVNNAILKEAQRYNATITLLQGTSPLSWTLLSGPERLRLDQATGTVSWNGAQAGNHTVSVEIANQVGTAVVQWTLQVERGYDAFLNHVTPALYAEAQPVTLSGHIEYITDNFVQDFLASIVPVYIDVISNGATRTLKTFTGADGLFSQVFYPAATEYGTYTAGARHPSLSMAVPQTEWSFLGMSATPHIITLNGEAINEFQATFHNVSIICNDGPGTLSGVIATPVITTPNLNVVLFLNGLLPNNTLRPGDKAFMDIQVTTSMPLFRVFSVELSTTQGTSLQFFVRLQIEQILPSFTISPPFLHTRITRGRSRVYEFNITNVGRAEASNVRSLIPDTDIFSFISFGGPQQSDDSSINLGTGEFATLSILIQTAASQQLGDISASIVIASGEISRAIPITLIVSSNTLMNLTVIVEDEYTYFASGQPLVDNAIVTIINYQRSVRITKSTSVDNGTVTFENIHEDRYDMIIEAQDHRALRQVIITSINEPTLVVFIQRQAVTYTWSVTPVTFEDTYILTVEADFETHVPIPVVTVTPTEFDLEELELGFIDSIQLNITNHGLIRANDVNIELPNNHPFLEFTISSNELGNLEPLSSITATIQISRRITQKRAVVNTVIWTVYIIKIAYNYVCGDLQLRSIPVILRKQTVITTAVNPPIVQCNNCGGGVSGGPGFSFSGYAARTPAFCNECLQTILNCLPEPNFPNPGCIQEIRSVISSSLEDIVFDAISLLDCVVDNKWIKGINKLIGKAKEIEGRINCISDIYNKCLASESNNRRKRSLISSVNELVEAMYPIHLSIALGYEVLGDEQWLTVGDPMWLSQVLRPVLKDDSELGVQISDTELSAILAVSPPSGASLEMVTNLATRLNNTIQGWNNGSLEPVEGANMASFSAVQELAQTINTYNERAISKGFSSYLDAYSYARNDVNQIDDWEEEAGVCAVVRIRIEQELAVTREAFLAKLEIENQEDTPLEQMDLEIIIVDSNSGLTSTHLFAIDEEKLSGALMRVGQAWTLPSAMSGAAEWLIVPYSEAAPDSDHNYDVGGTLRYTLEDENITIPLLPTLITVRPDPSLRVHYFWEKNVIGDDPFTDEVEPSVPFTLGVAVKNTGYGTANRLQITSGQPEIIENERGLLINFMIIGANVGGGSISPSLTVMLGDLAPNTTIVARWLIISSLQGEFKNYSATFENVNPLGDPKLSILDELEIHELIRNVRIYDSEDDDGILDFLVNERIDFQTYPDALYSSSNLARYNVSAGEILHIRASSVVAFTLEVRTVSNCTGWVYYRYEDTQNLFSRTALAVNTTKVEGNETIDIPPENVWITSTSDSRRNTVTFYLHIVDYVTTTEDLIFNMTLCTSDCPIVEKPYVPPPAAGVPPTTTAMLPTFTTTRGGEMTLSDETTTGNAAVTAKGSFVHAFLSMLFTAVPFLMLAQLN